MELQHLLIPQKYNCLMLQCRSFSFLKMCSRQDYLQQTAKACCLRYHYSSYNQRLAFITGPPRQCSALELKCGERWTRYDHQSSLYSPYHHPGYLVITCYQGFLNCIRQFLLYVVVKKRMYVSVKSYQYASPSLEFQCLNTCALYP